MKDVIIIGVIILVVLFFLFKLLKLLFDFIKGLAKTSKEYATLPGAQEAYDLLKRRMINGYVSNEALETASEIMASKGASPDDIQKYLMECKTLLEMKSKR